MTTTGEPGDLESGEAAETELSAGYRRFDCTAGDASRNAAATEAARQAIEADECIVLPTDTVYGIGADAFSAKAVRRLLEAKHRGRDMPPPVLIGEPTLIRALAVNVAEAAWVNGERARPVRIDEIPSGLRHNDSGLPSRKWPARS